MKNLPGLDSKSVDDFADILKKFGRNSTDNETIDGVVSDNQLPMCPVRLTFEFCLFSSILCEFQLQLLGMAVQGSTCGRTKIDLNQMFQSINNEETRAKASGKTSHYMTQDELSIINAELAKLLTPPQTKHAMRILQGFRENATDNEKDAALVSFIRREEEFCSFSYGSTRLDSFPINSF